MFTYPFSKEQVNSVLFGKTKIVSMQRDVMIAAAATAVGINMTFFMPFVLLNRKWGREHRGLAKFDLWTALLIPMLLPLPVWLLQQVPSLMENLNPHIKDYENRVLHPNLAKGYNEFVTARLELEVGKESYQALAPIQKEEMVLSIPESDKKLAAMLVKRDAFNLASSLEALLANKTFSHYIFGIGVVGMALSTIIILMTINGHAICEILGKPHKGPSFSRWCIPCRYGCTWTICLERCSFLASSAHINSGFHIDTCCIFELFSPHQQQKGIRKRKAHWNQKVFME